MISCRYHPLNYKQIVPDQNQGVHHQNQVFLDHHHQMKAADAAEVCTAQ